MILLGHKRPLFCASSQVQTDLFSLLPSSLSSSPLQVETSSGRQKAGFLPIKAHENHKNYVSVLTVLSIFFCSGSRKGKFSPTRELSLGMNAHLVVSEWGSQRAGGTSLPPQQTAAGTGQNPCRENNTLKRRAFQNNCIFRFSNKTLKNPKGSKCSG